MTRKLCDSSQGAESSSVPSCCLVNILTRPPFVQVSSLHVLYWTTLLSAQDALQKSHLSEWPEKHSCLDLEAYCALQTLKHLLMEIQQVLEGSKGLISQAFGQPKVQNEYTAQGYAAAAALKAIDYTASCVQAIWLKGTYLPEAPLWPGRKWTPIIPS